MFFFYETRKTHHHSSTIVIIYFFNNDITSQPDHPVSELKIGVCFYSNRAVTNLPHQLQSIKEVCLVSTIFFFANMKMSTQFSFKTKKQKTITTLFIIIRVRIQMARMHTVGWVDSKHPKTIHYKGVSPP